MKDLSEVTQIIQNKASKLIEENPIAHVVINIDWNIEYINKKFYEFFNIKNEQLLHKHISSLNEIIPAFNNFDEIKSKINKDEKWYNEIQIVNVKNKRVWISNYLIPLRDRNKKIFNYLLLIQDITDQKKIIDQLRKLSRAVEQSPASVVITDISGVIEYVNPKFCELTGYTFEELINKNCSILKSGEMGKNDYKNLWDTILAGNEWSGKFYNKKKDGSFYWEAALISPVKNEYNEITHFIGVKEDITERKISKEALKNSEKNLRIRNETIEKDLQNARQIQLALLPTTPPDLKRLKVKYRFLPLEAVGGDYFSFYNEDENELGIFVADVVGHGVSAALFLALLKYTTEIVSRSYKTKPELYLENLNQALYYGMYNYFITGVYGIFTTDSDNVNFTFANGGHPPLIYHNSLNNEVVPIKAKGTIIGMLENMKYTSQTISLNKGDRIYFYTDGIPETRNEENEIIGFQNVHKIIKNVSTPDLDETLDKFIVELKNFKDEIPFEDDIVIICVEVC